LPLHPGEPARRPLRRRPAASPSAGSTTATTIWRPSAG